MGSSIGPGRRGSFKEMVGLMMWSVPIWKRVGKASITFFNPRYLAFNIFGRSAWQKSQEEEEVGGEEESYLGFQ
jgi:hypothetical protein